MIFLRLLTFAVMFVLIPCAAISQVSIDQTDSKTAVRQIVQAMGISPTEVGTVTSVAVGKMTLVGEQPLTGSIKYETSGSDKIRSEFQAPDGLVVRIVNSGEGTIQRPNKPTRRLSRNNTVFGGITHIPVLSRLADASIGNADITSLSQVSTILIGRVALAASKAKASDVSRLQALTQQEFEIDPITGTISKLRYTSYGDDDDVSKTKVEIVYSDYRVVQGIAVPFHQQTYLDGVLRAELVLDSVQFNGPISETDFALAEVK